MRKHNCLTFLVRCTKSYCRYDNSSRMRRHSDKIIDNEAREQAIVKDQKTLSSKPFN
jgi:hypothetical protein